MHKSAACFRAQSIAVHAPLASNFVASTALGGAFRLEFPRNGVTIAFGNNAKSGASLLGAYQTFHPKNVTRWLPSVLYQSGNAVLLWDKAPSNANRDLVDSCLKT